jgi:hypothetical protein
MEWNVFWLLPECILKAAILCSMGWFEKKLMDVLVVAGLRNMSISRLDGFWIISISRKLIHLLLLYVALSFIFVHIDEVRVCYFVVIYRVSQEECAKLRESVRYVKVY